MLCCKRVWINWEQLRCGAHSPPIVGMTIALLFSLGTCIVQMQSVRVNFAFTKKLFNLSAEAIINVRDAGLCARCANFHLKIKKNRSFLSFGHGVNFFEKSPKWNQHAIADVFYSVKYCFNRGNWESLHLYLWKLWSQVVCSQSTFFVTRARKGDRNRHNKLLLR